MREPEWIDVATPAVHLRALTWGPPNAPIALCLHGFPDTARGWRNGVLPSSERASAFEIESCAPLAPRPLTTVPFKPYEK